MKFALLVSLGVNVVLGVCLLVVRADSPQPISGKPSSEHKALPTSPLVTGDSNQPGRDAELMPASAAIAFIWTADPSKVDALLKAQGASRQLRLAILRSRMADKYAGQRLNLLWPEGINRWSSDRSSPDPAKMAKLDEMYRTQRDEIRRVMGVDMDLALLDEDPVRKLKWGNIPQGQVPELLKVLEDWDSIRLRTSYARGLDPKSLAQERQFDLEFEKDIRATLSGPAADDFLLYNSPFSKALQNDLSRAKINLDEATYRQFIEVAKNTRENILQQSQSAPLASGTVLQEEFKAFRGVLGDEAAIQMAAERFIPLKDLNEILIGAGVANDARANLIQNLLTGLSALSTGDGASKNPQYTGAQAAVADQLLGSIADHLSEADIQKLNASEIGRTLNRLKARVPGRGGP